MIFLKFREIPREDEFKKFVIGFATLNDSLLLKLKEDNLKEDNPQIKKRKQTMIWFGLLLLAEFVKSTHVKNYLKHD